MPVGSGVKAARHTRDRIHDVPTEKIKPHMPRLACVSADEASANAAPVAGFAHTKRGAQAAGFMVRDCAIEKTRAERVFSILTRR